MVRNVRVLFCYWWGAVWQINYNTFEYILNNFTHISTHIFTRTYIKNTTILLKLTYQTASLIVDVVISSFLINLFYLVVLA